MSRTKGIALPSKSMEEATRNAQKDFMSKNPKAVDSATVKGGTEESPIVSEPSLRDRTATHTDDLQCLEAGIDRYTSIKEHGMSVWVVGKVKVKLDELKFRSRNMIGCRAFTNAALEFVLEKYGDELVKMFKNK
jgi:hypothetical protein